VPGRTTALDPFRVTLFHIGQLQTLETASLLKIGHALSLDHSVLLAYTDPLRHMPTEAVIKAAEICSRKQELILPNKTELLESFVNEITQFSHHQAA
jgi:hypothetical protein